MQSKALEDKELKAADRRSQEVLLTVQRFTRKNATGEPAGADSSVTGRMSSGTLPSQLVSLWPKALQTSYQDGERASA